MSWYILLLSGVVTSGLYFAAYPIDLIDFNAILEPSVVRFGQFNEVNFL